MRLLLVVALLFQLVEAVLLPKLPPILRPGGRLPSPLAIAADQTPPFDEPANLSRSGAAAQPRLVLMPDGRKAAFWWDRFDGLALNLYDGKKWLGPKATPIYNSSQLQGPPEILADSFGFLHAFWMQKGEYLGKETTNLMYAYMDSATRAWQAGRSVAEGVGAFAVAGSPTGGLDLVYLRNRNSVDYPSGIYFRQKTRGGTDFTTAQPVTQDIYYRLLNADAAGLRIAAFTAGKPEDPPLVFLAWNDPRADLAMFALSADGGHIWQPAEPFPGDKGDVVNARFLPLNNTRELVRFWQVGGPGDCTIYQQAGKAEGPKLTWGEAIRVYKSLPACPKIDGFWPQDNGALWVQGVGGSNLSFQTWQKGDDKWSLPLSQSITFTNAETGRQVTIGQLSIGVSGDMLQVLGADSSGGDIWFTSLPLSALNFSYTPLTEWSDLQAVGITGTIENHLSIGLDPSGAGYLVWGHTSSTDNRGDGLFFSSISGDKPSRPLAVVNTGSGEVARQPDMLVESNETGANGQVSVVWSGGVQGMVLYARMSLKDARNLAAWPTPQTIAEQAGAVWPKIARAPSGVLYVLYAVPVNNQRGIYLLRSEDGITWSKPVAVFDAAAAGWDMANQPSLVITADGTLHAAWSRLPLPGMGFSLGVYYARSIDGGQTWTSPVLLAGSGNDWPTLACAGDSVHLLFRKIAESNVYERISSPAALAAKPEDWGLLSNVPGLRVTGEVNDTGAPYSVIAGTKTLHLVAIRPQSGDVQYLSWEKDWSSPNLLAAPERLETRGNPWLGVTVAIQPQTGQLVVAWKTILRPSIDQKSASSSSILDSRAEILVSQRAVTKEAAGQAWVMPATPTPAATVVLAAAQVIPTPTAVLEPAQGSLIDRVPSLPLILGIGLPATGVILFLAWRLGFRRRPF